MKTMMITTWTKWVCRNIWAPQTSHLTQGFIWKHDESWWSVEFEGVRPHCPSMLIHFSLSTELRTCSLGAPSLFEPAQLGTTTCHQNGPNFCCHSGSLRELQGAQGKSWWLCHGLCHVSHVHSAHGKVYEKMSWENGLAAIAAFFCFSLSEWMKMLCFTNAELKFTLLPLRKALQAAPRKN